MDRNLRVIFFIFIGFFLSQDSIGQINEPLVEVIKLDSTIIIDLKYATIDNFVGEKLYSVARCYLRQSVAERLVRVQQTLRKRGLGLKIWDGYRPLSVQKKLWQLVPEKDFVANPYRGGSYHNRGAAVDVTLVDLKGNELAMPSAYDDFSYKARRSYQGASAEAIKNRKILTDAMIREGFSAIQSEWWHFNAPDPKRYPILDIPIYSLDRNRVDRSK